MNYLNYSSNKLVVCNRDRVFRLESNITQWYTGITNRGQAKG